MPLDASKMYGKNICNFLHLIINEEGKISLNFEDEVVKGALVSDNGFLSDESTNDVISGTGDKLING